MLVRHAGRRGSAATVFGLMVPTLMGATAMGVMRDAVLAFNECVAERAAPESRTAIVTYSGVDWMQIGLTDHGGWDAGPGGCGRGPGPVR